MNMNSIVRRIRLSVTFVATAMIVGCEPTIQPEASGPGQEYLFQIPTSGDTYTISGWDEPGDGANVPLAWFDHMVVSNLGFRMRTGYLQYEIPPFPDGTVVTSARLALYCDGVEREPWTDDGPLTLSGTVHSSHPWDEDRITWNNPPSLVRSLSDGEFFIPVAIGWMLSDDVSLPLERAIAGENRVLTVQLDLKNPDLYEYLVWIRSSEYVQEYPDSLDKGPRLLLAVTLPEGATFTEGLAPEGHQFSEDLDRWKWRYQQGREIPQAWLP